MLKDLSKGDKKISKNLSWILRHGAVKEGIDIDEEGYCFVDELLKLEKMGGVNLKDIKNIVENNDKQRFSLIKFDQRYKIRANQGHSNEVASKLNFKKILKKIENSSDIPICIHGTYKKVLDTIKQNGLSRRGRHAIHFCTGFDAKSGYRKTCEVAIYIDVEKAIADGFEFYKSDNDVILCEGDINLKDKDGFTGIVPPKYFKNIVYLK